MDSDLMINRDTIPDYNTLCVCSLAGFREKKKPKTTHRFFLYTVILIQILTPTSNVGKTTEWFPKRILAYD